MSSAASFYELEAEKPKGDKIKFEVRCTVVTTRRRAGLEQAEPPRGAEGGSLPRSAGHAARVLTRSHALQDYKGKVVLITNTATHVSRPFRSLASPDVGGLVLPSPTTAR